MIFKTETLNAVLHHLNTNRDSSIAEYFYSKNMRDEKVINDCRAELKKSGYINFYTIADYGIKESLTGIGLDFISKGGYSGKMKDAIENEKRSKKLQEAALKLIGKPQTPIVSIVKNKAKIEYALQELDHLIGILETKNSFQPPQLRSYHSTIKTIVEGVFLPGHKIYREFENSHLIKDEIWQIAQNAIHYLEYESIDLKTDLNGIHPKISEVAAQLYLDGHYREAIDAAHTYIVEEVKSKFQIKDGRGNLLDGRPLMERVFSPDNPVYSISDQRDYQEGWKLLYCGSVSAIRNKYVHNKQSKVQDADYALNLLHFASALLRILENKEIY